MSTSGGARRFFRHRPAVLSLVFVAALGLLAAFADHLTPVSYEVQNIAERLQPPSFSHWMGTDVLGRDLYSRIVYGARLSLAVGLVSAFVALFFGTVTGALAGFFGGWVERIVLACVDFLYTVPSLLLAILVMVMAGRGVFGILFALGITSWVAQARLVRAQVKQAKNSAHVEAAVAVGAGPWVVLFRHILPNLMGPIVVAATFQVPTNIMAESFLSFIGLGLEPPYSSWGTLASEGFRAVRSYPHLVIFPGGALFLTLLAFGFMGDGLRDALDPRAKEG